MAGITNVLFRQADIFALPFSAESFDHIFVCFVLEHLARPVEALAILGRLLRVGGTITLIEGDHGSTYFYPDSEAAHAAIQCQITLQRAAGGNALIGRQIYPLLVEARAAISAGLIRAETFDTGVRDLYRTTESDGVFCYTFFKGVGKKRRDA